MENDQSKPDDMIAKARNILSGRLIDFTTDLEVRRADKLIELLEIELLDPQNDPNIVRRYLKALRIAVQGAKNNQFRSKETLLILMEALLGVIKQRTIKALGIDINDKTKTGKVSLTDFADLLRSPIFTTVLNSLR